VGSNPLVSRVGTGRHIAMFVKILYNETIIKK